MLLVRHGVTDWNREGRFQGHLDPPLSPDGLDQARLLAARLAAMAEDRPARIVSSPLSRALETAQAIVSALNEPEMSVEVDPRLMELGQGEWEGRTHAELSLSDLARYAAWRRRTPLEPPPGGEPIGGARKRVQAALNDAVIASDRSGNWPLCLVAHGGSLRLAAGQLFDLPLDSAWGLEMDNASLSVLDPIEGGWRLVTWNDASHLLGRGMVHVDEQDGEPLAL